MKKRFTENISEYEYWNYMTSSPMRDGEEIRSFLDDLQNEDDDRLQEA